MARGKQYGLKVIHKASNKTTSENWFNTELERKTAIGGIKLEPGYIFYLEEKPTESPSNAPKGEWSGPA